MSGREPAVITAAVMAVIQAAIGLLVVFGVELTPEQTGAVLGFSGAFLALVTGLVIRGQVTPMGDPRASDGMPLVRADR